MTPTTAIAPSRTPIRPTDEDLDLFITSIVELLADPAALDPFLSRIDDLLAKADQKGNQER